MNEATKPETTDQNTSAATAAPPSPAPATSPVNGAPKTATAVQLVMDFFEMDAATARTELESMPEKDRQDILAMCAGAVGSIPAALILRKAIKSSPVFRAATIMTS